MPIQLAEKNYFFAKNFYKYQHRRQLKNTSAFPIIIYQMGKVGSKTIRISLKSLGLKNPIYHSHILTADRNVESENKRRKFFRTDRHAYLQRPWLNQFLYQEIKRGLNSKKWKIITLTREPISRNISTFFENLEASCIKMNYEYIIKSDYYDIPSIVVKIDHLHELMRLFFEKTRHNTPLDFFDLELKSIFGFNVYAQPFPISKGYKVYKTAKADFLVMRLENLNKCAKEAFKEFLGIQSFTLIQTNVGIEKKSGFLYKKFKESLILPKSYIDKMYNSKYMRHFYSKNEIKQFVSGWNST